MIHVGRAVQDTEQGLRAQAVLNKLFDNRQADLANKQRQLQADKEALDKEAQAGKTPREQLQKRYETLQRAAAELQGRISDSQREMQRKEEDLKTPILQGHFEAAKRIALQDGFDMVLEKSAVPHFRGELDITNRTIRLYNGGLPAAAPAAPGGKGAPAAPPAAPTGKARVAPVAPAPKK